MQIIKSPIITEKSYNLSSNGKYVFEVDKNANKNQIKKAVSDFYKVEVVKVNITKRKAKESQHGKQKKVKAAKKIAIITLAKDQKIELFEESKE